jgi:hypothetical protein
METRGAFCALWTEFLNCIKRATASKVNALLNGKEGIWVGGLVDWVN